MLSYFSPASHSFNLAAQISRKKEPHKCSIWSFELDVGSGTKEPNSSNLYRQVINNLQLIFSRIGGIFYYLK